MGKVETNSDELEERREIHRVGLPGETAINPELFYNLRTSFEGTLSLPDGNTWSRGPAWRGSIDGLEE